MLNYRKKPAVSFLTYNNHKLYLGNFIIFGHSQLRAYNVDKKGRVELNSRKIISDNFGRFIVIVIDPISPGS